MEREGRRPAHFSLPAEAGLSSADRHHVPGLIAPVHVPLRTQDSSVTRPGDMGTSSAKVNGLFRVLSLSYRRGRRRVVRGYMYVTEQMGNAHVEAVTNPLLVLSCYVARRLDILRSARIPCRAITRSNDRVGMYMHDGTTNAGRDTPRAT